MGDGNRVIDARDKFLRRRAENNMDDPEQDSIENDLDPKQAEQSKDFARDPRIHRAAKAIADVELVLGGRPISELGKLDRLRAIGLVLEKSVSVSELQGVEVGIAFSLADAIVEESKDSKPKPDDPAA